MKARHLLITKHKFNKTETINAKENTDTMTNIILATENTTLKNEWENLAHK